MKDINDMSKKEFKELKTLVFDEEIMVDSLVLLPTRIRDSSGYNLYDIVACYHNKALGRIGFYDTHSIFMENKFNRVGIDCLRTSCLMRIFLPDNYVVIPYMHSTKIKGSVHL